MNGCRRARCRTCLSLRDLLRECSTIAGSAAARSASGGGKKSRATRVLGGYLSPTMNIDRSDHASSARRRSDAVMMKRSSSATCSRGDPQHAPPRVAQARRDRDPPGVDPLKAGAKDLSATAEVRRRQGSCDRLEIEEVRKEFGPKTEPGKRRHRLRRGTGDRRRRDAGGDDREGAGHDSSSPTRDGSAPCAATRRPQARTFTGRRQHERAFHATGRGLRYCFCQTGGKVHAWKQRRCQGARQPASR